MNSLNLKGLCLCTFAQRMVGDGCYLCNFDFQKDWRNATEEEIKEAEEWSAKLWEDEE